ncbi:MAG TPA: rhodanese-like domain-containing protein [Spirochaetota bacterium]|jgi:rhodanese-related sulfurtransferase|nr:MAG: Thiosulfate sulfurtransferase GlpE [Spirochaetes bacterium ADurb.BinA120]HNU92368.1 rhodanese-like domain-containing protein [Spirochaetota bacterium]HPV99125.1 rhodanese-like domain-containing protein [Spirochaetota bacterium]
MRRPGIIIPLIFLVISACSRVETLSPERAAAMIESGGVIVVDIRDPKKFADGHIEGAINAEYHPKTFARDTEQIDKNAAIILYCSMGLKTKKAVRELERRGFARVYAMEGGIEAWRNAGFPVSGR